MISRYYTASDLRNREPVGFCELSGWPFPRSRIIRESELINGMVVFTGRWIGDVFQSAYNDQHSAPLVINDLKPVEHPLPPVSSQNNKSDLVFP